MLRERERGWGGEQSPTEMTTNLDGGGVLDLSERSHIEIFLIISNFFLPFLVTIKEGT